MRTPRAILLLTVLCAAYVARAQIEPPRRITRTPAEFSCLLDADGDGDLDLVTADRASGLLRVGRRTSSTSVTWESPTSGGIAPLDGFTAGRVLTNARHAVVLTGMLANRAAVLDLASAGSARTPRPLFPQSAGPRLVVALNTVPASSTDELFLSSDLNGGGAFFRQLFQTTGFGTFAQLDFDNGPFPFTFAAGLCMSNGAIPRVAGLLPDTDEIYLFSIGNNGASVGLQPPRSVPLSDSSQFIFGGFVPTTPLGQFLVFTPGVQTAYSIPLEPNHTYGAVFGTATPLGLPVRPWSIQLGPGVRQLTLITANGAASVYDFDGTTLAPHSTMELPAGVSGGFTALCADPSAGQLFMLIDTDGDRASDTSCRYTFNGRSFVAADPAVAMPALSERAGRPNTLAFVGEPLVNTNAARIAAYTVADWSVSASGVTPSTTIQAAIDRGAALGLGVPAATVINDVPADATHLLLDQLASDIAVQPLFTAAGESVSVPRMEPEGGLFDSAVQVTITAPASVTRILYRLNAADPWTQSAGRTQTFWLYADTTVQCFGWNNANNRTTPIISGDFTFSRPPEEQDSDGDGVPDFVELALGLDPAGGQDDDGDGLLDLDEILGGTRPDLVDSDGDGATDREERAAGTDPNNASSVPSESQILSGTQSASERHAVFDLFLSPRPYDGVIAAYTVAATNVPCRITALDGSLLASSVTRETYYPYVPMPNLVFSNLPIPFEGLFAGFTTPAHFNVYTLSADPRIGRELVKLITAPAQPPVSVAYSWSGGDPSAEVTAWSNAAQTAYAAAVRPEQGESATVVDTLTAALFETFVARELSRRGLLTASAVSLFPARTEPESLPHPSAADLLLIQTAGDRDYPAYNLVDTLSWLRTACTNTAYTDVTALRTLAHSIYGVASLQMNDAPGQYPLPFDAIRAVVQEGTVTGAYTNHIGAAELNLAKQGSDRLLGLIPARPRLTLHLLAGASQPPDSAVLADPDSGLRYSLVSAGGAAFPLVFAFAVPSNSTLHVEGFLNGADTRRGADFEVEVITLSATALPAPTPVDQDANLLPDAYEHLVFGVTGTPLGRDWDNDGYSDLQEYLEGCDPTDATVTPAVAAVALEPPEAHIALDGSDVRVFWLWPARYHNRFDFILESTPALGALPFAASTPSVNAADDLLDIRLPTASEGPQRFYRIRVRLR